MFLIMIILESDYAYNVLSPMYIRDDLKLSILKDRDFLVCLLIILINYLTFVVLFIVLLNPPSSFIHLVIFHVLAFMLLWSYISAIVLDPGYTPLNWAYEDQDNEQDQDGRRRFCFECNGFQPERAHHVFSCQRCVMGYFLQLGNIACVGFKTTKIMFIVGVYWILISLYTVLVELWLVFSESDWSFLYLFRWIVVISSIVQAFFSIKFIKILFILVKTNGKFQEDSVSVYDVGIKQNFLQVFGTNKWLWILPVFPESSYRVDGIHWPKNR